MRDAAIPTTVLLTAALCLGAGGCKEPSSGEEIPWPEETNETESGSSPSEGEPEPATEDEAPAAADQEPAAADEEAGTEGEESGEQTAASETAGEEVAAGEDGEEPEAVTGKVDRGPGKIVLDPADEKMGKVSFKHKGGASSISDRRHG
jgi:hypothetical protein